MSSQQKYCSGVLSFLIIWLIILMVPRQLEWTVRQLTLVQPQALTTAFPANAAVQKVLLHHPNDPRVLSFVIEKQYQDAYLKNLDQHNGVPNNDAYYLTIKDCIQQYDALIARFPDEHWLVQNRLRLTLAGIDVVNFNYGTVFSGKEVTHRRIYPHTVNDNELNQAIILTQQAMANDPSNSFYNWAQATFYFALKQPDKAVNSLEKGAGKNHFDDGILVEMQRRAGIMKLTGTDSWARLARLWEISKHTEGASTFPFNWTTWSAIHQAALLEKSGNHQRALAIYGAVMGATNTLIRQQTFNDFRDNFLYRLLPKMWAAETRQLPRLSGASVLTAEQSRQRRIDNWLGVAQQFARYANSHQRPDLAKQAISLARQYAPLADQQWQDSGQQKEVAGISITSADQLARFYWVQSQVLFIVILCAIFTIIAFLMLHFFFPQNSSSHITVSIWDILGAAVFSITVTAFYFNTVLKLATPDEGIFLKAALINFPYFDIRNSVAFLGNLSLWGPIILVMIFMVWCRLSVMWRTRKIAYPQRGNFGGVLFRWGRVVGSLLVIFLLLLWAFAVQVILPWRLHTLLLAIAPAFIYLIFMLVHKSFVVFQNMAIYRQRIHYFYLWLPRFLATFCLLGSVVYLLLALSVLPRHTAARFEALQLFKNGEVTEQIMPPPPPAR